MQLLQLLLCAALSSSLLLPHASSALEFKLPLGPYYFNPSVVWYRGSYLTTARTAFMRGVAGRWWWFNEAYLCQAAAPAFESPTCARLDPWRGTFKECAWSGLVDTAGSEDPKLFVWPGRGLFVLLTRKPSRAAADRHGTCRTDQPWLSQYLFPIVLEPGAGEWALEQPVQLRVNVPQFYFEQELNHQIIKEKNWMPFLWHDQLYMVHSVYPQHRIMHIPPTGAVTKQYITNSSGIFRSFEGRDVHGGPPAVYVPPVLPVLPAAGNGVDMGYNSSSGSGNVSGRGRSGSSDRVTISTAGSSIGSGLYSSSTGGGYYLGVLHYFVHEKTSSKDIKRYHHFFYKFKAAPPFAPCAVSSEIPLVFEKDKHDLSGAGGGLVEDSSGQQRQWQQQQGTEHYKQQRIWKDTSRTAFVSGLFLKDKRHKGAAPHGWRAAQLLVSYGSGDVDARLLVMSLAEVEAMFSEPHDCAVAPPEMLPTH